MLDKTYPTGEVEPEQCSSETIPVTNLPNSIVRDESNLCDDASADDQEKENDANRDSVSMSRGNIYLFHKNGKNYESEISQVISMS